MAEEWKYQYSNSDGNGGILVVRTNEADEVEGIIAKVDALVGKSKVSQPSMIPVNNTPTMTGENKLWCTKHGVAMRLNKNNKPYHMDSARAEGDKFCNGYGFPAERYPEAESSKQVGERLDQY